VYEAAPAGRPGAPSTFAFRPDASAHVRKQTGLNVAKRNNQNTAEFVTVGDLRQAGHKQLTHGAGVTVLSHWY